MDSFICGVTAESAINAVFNDRENSMQSFLCLTLQVSERKIDSVNGNFNSASFWIDARPLYDGLQEHFSIDASAC